MRLSGCFMVAVMGMAVGMGGFAWGNESWPEYRGPFANGHSDSTGLPLKWSEKQNVKWKVPIHGRAWSTPVILANQIWMTTATKDGKKMYAICVARDTGKILLDKLLFTNKKPRPLSNSVNSYGSPSAVIEEGRVYIHFGSYGTACLDTKTFKVLWERRDFECNHYRGPASSPLLVDDKLVLTFDGSDLQYSAAVYKATGKTAWRTKRSTDYGDVLPNGKFKANGDFRKSYNTPIVIMRGDRKVLVSPAAKAVYGLDAHTGKEYWQVRYKQHSSASRVVYGHGLLFVNTGYSRPEMKAVRPGGSGDVTETHVAWHKKKGLPNQPSPLLIGDYLYLLSDGGVVSCRAAKTGKLMWQGRIKGKFSASLLYADGRIYAFNNQGLATVLKPGKEFKVLATNELDAGFMASPAVAGKALFLRTRTHLYRIEK